jgi:hypothetical protein
MLLSPHPRHLPHRHIAHGLHHLFHLFELFHKCIDLRNVLPAALGQFLVCVKVFMESGFALSKGVIELIIASMPLNASSLISISFMAFTNTWYHAHQIFQVTHFFDLLQLVHKILEIELIFTDLLSLIFLLLLHHIAPALFLLRLVISPMPKIRCAIRSGIEHIQRIHLLTTAHKLDRFVYSVFDR